MYPRVADNDFVGHNIIKFSFPIIHPNYQQIKCAVYSAQYTAHLPCTLHSTGQTPIA